eukprot:765927-Hanusia_phi.AAC.7
MMISDTGCPDFDGALSVWPWRAGARQPGATSECSAGARGPVTVSLGDTAVRLSTSASAKSHAGVFACNAERDGDGGARRLLCIRRTDKRECCMCMDMTIDNRLCLQYSANCGVVYVYGPPGFQPKTWGQGTCFDPTMVSLPADYVEVFQ